MSATGRDLLQLALPHVGETYVLGAKVPKDNPNWKGPWDCAEFVSWVVYQAAGILYGCDKNSGKPSTADAYTGYWQRDATKLGQIISLEDAAKTPGAAVLRYPAGAIGHVVLSDGKGGTVEAHSSADGVIKGKLANRRWDIGILVPGITYDQLAVNPRIKPPATVLRLSNSKTPDPAVLELQTALTKAGYATGDIDGLFGPHTQAAVVAFQLAHGLTADGEVGPITAAALGLDL